VILSIVLGVLAVLSALLNLWQWVAARRFALRNQSLVTSTATQERWPGVSCLKPLKGCDSETAECLRSWLRQDYPGPCEILFGVASAEDPVCALVGDLLREYSSQNARLIVCPESLGPNAKVSTLAHLEREARHGIFVVSDADVRVPPSFLSLTVPILEGSSIGLVNCFYSVANPLTLPMHWEALAVNADFWSQVLQSRTLKPLDFALGAVMLTRREHLQAFGGFETLAQYLADDYELGQRISRLGLKIELASIPVECWSGPMNWGEVWSHQLRWSRTIRVCQPLPYFLSILSNATMWPLLWAGLRPETASIAVLATAAVLRISTAADNEKRLTAGKCPWHAFLAPIKDLLQFVIWALAYLGNEVRWRGIQYRVLRGGRLEELS
jgi:ceramide glucosyltransferase